MDDLFAAHAALLKSAVAASRERGFWAAFPENPKAYPEGATTEAKAAFAGLRNKLFVLTAEDEAGPYVGAEVSPFGPVLGITYVARTVDDLVARAQQAGAAWAAAGVERRVGVALEILVRLNKASFLVAEAVEHTTGQAGPMAFQAGGPHAQDRGLEAVAYAYEEMARVPGAVRWEKPAGRSTIRLDKDFHVVPRGVGLVIGCATFPTWNSYPALFADLVTGNAVIVKPHPAAILPLALTVKIGREVLTEQGFDPDVLQLAPDTADAPVAKDLATHPAIGMVDFTGSSAFGGWLRETLRDKLVFTEEAGVNTIVIASTGAFAAMCANIAFSLSLYSGQMCTAPQTIFVPAAGIATDEGHKSFDEVASGIGAAIDALLSDPARAAAVLGAIQNPATLTRIEEARGLGRIVRASAALQVEGARTATPLLLAVEADDEAAYLEERFGPIAFVVAVSDAQDAIARATRAARQKGAITAALYSTDEAEIATAIPAYAKAGVALSVNLTGGIYVNQSAAFSDYHVSGANPAGNACMTDAAFVASRFRVVCVRRPAAA
ncbi:MAG: phenylacetic acid degradation protein PaaN [Rhizobiales bacterium 24-66-13]|jgi:phenylacetic acid degradation protein paaN|nr:MAG: phenylacetic acid degradation protein PaaN [Rhizobiales bacterium 24-66-13]OZB11691.1 MAG: phenylacetic acid degradation protein PaaN [Rhizobiales bacterium 39-66-18]HQS09587.1 phenylacetic acid degradation protein PaaN [Xanthobacteraceae bacterium]HQS44849.1 phenylacetic acid degradation protein PaaN [Xanthobacteraceae bacterium]